MTSQGLRPAPEALLLAAAREGRGRLKVFLGAAPGVGKTYAMLEAARVRLGEGLDVLAAVIETHGRHETEALLHGVPVLPRRPVIHRGRILTEMDLDALLARRPALALIDELAHTNAPESRHEKRWQDVEEVLAAGIDVYTTLNVQHVETLNQTVARITGVRVRETVPDRVLDEADEIELIDLPPDELLARLKAGKVYVQDQAARAVQHFFAKGNLTALRELSMRAAADRVDAQLREHMAANAIAGPWPAQDRILVVIDDGLAARDAIRVAKRASDRARAGWMAVTVSSSRGERLGPPARERVADALRLAARLGAELATVEAEHDAATEVLDFARRNNVRRIIIGRPMRRGLGGRLAALFGSPDLGRAILRQGRDFEITLAAGSADRPASGRRSLSDLIPTATLRDPRGYGVAALAIAVASAVAWSVDALVPVTSLSLVYMTAVVAVASVRGLGSAVAASGLGFVAYNFFFTEPRLTFQVSGRGEVLTLLLFVVASILTGNLAARLRARIEAQRAIVDRMGKLHDFSRRIASAASLEDVAWATVSNVAATLRCDTILLAPDAEGALSVIGGFPPEDRIEPRDAIAAQYAWDKGEPAGRGTGTLPMARWFLLPVRAGTRPLAVLGLGIADDGRLALLDRALLTSITDQVALALERVQLAEALSETRLASETERLRTALLSSVSHDLRTPLVAIIGAAGSLAEPPDGLGEESRRALAATIRDEGHRLDRYVQNLLDMTRLEHGALKVLARDVDLLDLVGTARQRLEGPLAGHALVTDIIGDVGPVRADPILTEQVLVNILDNAAKHAPPGTAITVSARAVGDAIEIAIEDEGPGVPAEARNRVFDMFYRIEGGDRSPTGTGLGLAIAKGLVEAQGGAIRAEAGRTGGLRVVLTLPKGTLGDAP